MLGSSLLLVLAADRWWLVAGRVGVAAGAPPRTDPDMVRNMPAEETMGARLHAADYEASDAAFTGLVGWVVQLVAAFGPLGVGLLLAIDNVFPVIPSEVVLPFAGYLASQGEMSFWVTFGAATVGSVVSAYVLYVLGRRLGAERARGVLLRIPLTDGEDVDRAVDWFARHGDAAVFTGRFVPLVRSLVSLPAGTEGLGAVRFGVLTACGSGIWNLLWLWVGRVVGENWTDVGRWSDWFNWSIVVVGVALVARYAWSRRNRL